MSRLLAGGFVVAEKRLSRFLEDHIEFTRRHLLKSTGLAGAALFANSANADSILSAPELSETLSTLERWLTKQNDFRDISRGKPKPHSLSDEERAAAGLTRESWKLNVISDPEYPAILGSPLEGEKAFTFEDLMSLAETKSVRFAKVMTCLNIGCPLGNGIWEGVPLRDVVWKTNPQEDLRRVFYYGFHNRDPEQMFRSSLPIGRVLEDYHGLPPVILCYKLNGQWLTPERGAPVRIVVPEDYGFKSIKWLTNVVLSNRPEANDTYAEKNNDVDSPLKTFCATLTRPNVVEANLPIPITGWAQAGIAGLAKVQVWIAKGRPSRNPEDPYWSEAPWQDAELLPFDADVGGGLPDDELPADVFGFEEGKPKLWPMPLTRAHWCFLHEGLAPGKYTLRCRTIDRNGVPQPMPRPFRKSGHAKIEQVQFEVK